MININETIKNAYEKWEDKDYIYEKKEGVFVPITYGGFIQKVCGFAHELLNQGLKDTKILIFGENSVAYMIADMAVLAYVGISVNVNCQTGEEELITIIKSLGIKTAIYDQKESALFEQVKSVLPEFHCICMQEAIGQLKGDLISFDFNEKDENACAKIIYSSGTTADPKGVMLSLKNIFSGWQPLQKRTPFSERDIDYLFLPLHHTYANIYNFIYSLLSGLSIYLCSGTENIETELKEVNPTIFCGVPLIYRKIYGSQKDNLSKAFGTNIRYLYCGGARFEPAIRKAYKECGLPMFEAYALTETASSFSIEYPNKEDFESVGMIFENVDAKIINQNQDGIGEILVKGDNVFLGYVNNEELTKKVFSEDGYFITGDYGFIREQKLYVIGRGTDVIVLENGEKVFVKEIEIKLKEYSTDIIGIQVSLQNNQPVYRILIKENGCVDIENILADYNSKVTKKDCVKLYNVVIANPSKNFKD